MKADELSFLVVDDDDFQRETLVDMLRSLGAVMVQQAGEGQQALEILRAEQPRPIDIVLCDLEMPGMDGIECFRHMGNTHPDISIIIISALNSTLITSVEKMVRAYGLRLLGAVEKPITLSCLQLLIMRYGLVQVNEHAADTVPSFNLEEVLQGVRNNQFEPFFQPKVDFVTGRINGAEALARWMHPKHGVIAPYAFISLLEQSKEINELTFIMLEKSAAICRKLRDEGHAVTMSINLSLTSLTDTTLANRIIRIMQGAGVDPHDIILEITETAAMTNVAYALENLARLRMHGFGLAIDDYGTGYSSMQQITRIAFSELKIDRSFVKDFTEHRSLRIIVESSIEMAHKLGMTCSAEGVETQQQWHALKQMGCDTAQGYFIAKPMSQSTFLKFCNEYTVQ